MARLRDNVLANYAGQAWMALMGVVFVPLYIRVLGVEGFGLVGLMLSIQALSMLLDLGMGGVLNRELARRTHDINASYTMGDLIRTFEWLVWPIALLLALMIWFASSPMATHWLHPQQLTRAETAHAVAILGLAVALQWPSSFYANGLSGLERQPMLNVINAGFATLRNAGVLVVLYWVSPTIAAFMWWYAAVGACQSLALAFTLWKFLPVGSLERAKFRRKELHATGRFAGGLMLGMILAIALTQIDRIVLSTMRPLVELGYFSLVLSVSAGMGRMVLPMFNALYPRYSRLVAQGEDKALIHLYHLSNQYLAVVIAAISVVLIIFSRDVMYLWTGDAAIAEKVALPLSILVAGTMLNGIMNLPYALQLAYGWTRLGIWANLVALMLGIPFCIWAVKHYGMTGAASLWFFINLGFVVVVAPLMHRRLMRGELARWYLQDILPPFLSAAFAGVAISWMMPALSRDLLGLLLLVIISGTVFFVAAVMSPAMRQLAKAQLLRTGFS